MELNIKKSRWPLSGVPGRAGADGTPGKDGKDGMSGIDGKNGKFFFLSIQSKEKALLNVGCLIMQERTAEMELWAQ